MAESSPDLSEVASQLKPEARESNSRDVVKALNNAKQLVKESVTDWNKPSREKWIYESIENAQSKCDLENGRDTFDQTILNETNGGIITRPEGIPVDELILFLREKAGTLKGAEKGKYTKLSNTLLRHSRPMSESSHFYDPAEYIERVRHEASLISQDTDYRKQQDIQGDWYESERVLMRRRDIVLPSTREEELVEDMRNRLGTAGPLPVAPPETPAINAEDAGDMRNRVTAGPLPPEAPAAPSVADEDIEDMRNRVTAGPLPAEEASIETPPIDEGTTVEEIAGGALEEPEAPIPAPVPEKPKSTEAEQPTTTPLEDVRYKLIVVSRQMEMRKRSEDMAETQIRDEQRRGSMFNPLNWARKTRMRVFDEQYRQQGIRRLETEMRTNNNSYLELDLFRNAAGDVDHDIDQEREAGASKIRELQDTGVRESGILRGGREEIREATGEIKTLLMNNIIRPIVNGEITDYAQVQETLRQFVQNNPDNIDVRELFGADSNRYGEEASYFATNLLEIGQRIRTDLEAHRFAIEQLDDVTTINLANADWATESQPHFTIADRAVARVRRSHRGGLIANPAFVGAATSIGVYGGMRLLGYGARATKLAPGAGLITGAAFSALRRNSDLKIDRASDQRALASHQETVGNAPRREALRRYSYDMATVDALRNGEVDRRALAGDTRGMRELVGLDLSTNPNRDALIRRMAEITTRLDFSGRENVDLIIFSAEHQIQQGRAELAHDIAEARIALRNSGLSNEEIDQRQQRFQGEWNSHFTQDRQQQDRAFAIYRYRSAAVAGVIGGATGFAAGFGLKEAIDHSGINPLGIFTEAGKGVEKFKDLFHHGGQTNIGNHMSAVVNPADHSASIIDTSTNQALANGGSIGPDGAFHNLVVGNGLDKSAVDQLKGNLDSSGFHTNITEHTVQSPSVLSQLQQVAGERQSATIHTQNGLEISVDGAGHISAIDPTTHLNIPGALDQNGNITFNNSADFSAFHQELAAAGFSVTEQQQAAGTVIDHLLTGSPDQLKARGIIETDTFQKNWNFHVLRPDIVSATGDHTHNELTEHFGQYMDARGVWVTGQKGVINFGGDLKGDLIPSNLPGVPAAHDQILDQLIANNGPIHHEDMLFAVDLNDGRQIMLPADSLGNAHLPAELVNQDTGQFQGIKSIASVLLQDRNGHLIKASELMNSGTIPDGTTVHSLASVALDTATPSAAPVNILTAVAPNTPIEIHTFALDAIPLPGHEAPIIPFPMSPRYPLEPLVDTPVAPPPIGEYYGGESLGEAQAWIASHPEVHKPYTKKTDKDGKTIWVDAEGNPVIRDIKREREEIKKFLSSLESSDPAHHKEITELATRIPSMNPQTRVAVNIPAWMEGKNIYDLLDQYTKQVDDQGKPLDPNLYEINIIVNRKTGTPADNSVAEIERFKKDAAEKGKTFNINYTDVEFKEPFNNVGNARRVITDMTLLRSLQRSTQSNSLYIESEDADLIHVDPKTIINLITKLDENPHLDAARGIQDRLPETMMGNDYLFLYKRMQDFKELLIRRKAYRPERNPRANYTWNRVITGGWNTGYTAEAYALIGGYNPYQTKGEDMIMGERMSMARGDGTNPNTDVIGKVVTRSDSSPRRYIFETATGQAAYGSDFEDPAVNAELRDKTPEELMERIKHLSRLSSSNQETFERMLKNEYQFIQATTPSEKEAQDVARFVLLYLGFKGKNSTTGEPADYEFADGNLKIKNWSNAEKALSDYRSRHAQPRKPGERTGNRTESSTSPTQSMPNPTPSAPTTTASITTILPEAQNRPRPQTVNTRIF